MKSTIIAAALAFGIGAGAALAAALPKTYQVTGPVLAITPDMITVQKDTDKWEIARGAATKVTGDPKVGATVTILYRMSATGITVQAK